MEPDKQLVKKIIGGDLDSFRELIGQYQQLVCHIVFRMVSNETDREEICQEIFIKIYRNLRKFEFRSKLSTWIARIAYNQSLNYLQKHKLPLYDDLTGRNGQNADDTPSGIPAASFAEKVTGELPAPDETITSQQVNRYLHLEINRLPAQYRTILTLFHLDGLSYREIGEITALPEGTVKNYLFRARKILKERLLNKFPVEEF